MFYTQALIKIIYKFSKKFILQNTPILDLNMIKKILCSVSIVCSTATFAAPTFKTYNPQDQALFAVSSTLIEGKKEVILVDAQSSIFDGEQLVKMIQKSGKELKLIIISAGDPDYYFGLQPIVAAFPHAKIVATPEVSQHIQKTKDAKLTYWGPILKEGAPSKLYVPEATKQTIFKLDGNEIQIKQAGKYASYLWVPSNRTVLGGVGVYAGTYVWTADTQTPEARQEWLNSLKQIEHLHPRLVIPGHYKGAIPKGDQAVKFTYRYLMNYENILKKYHDSTSVIHAIKTKYPNLSDEDSLAISAKVNTGEMKW